MNEARVQTYRLELTRLFGRLLTPKDGFPEARLRRAEQRLGLALPGAMRDFYRLAGAAPETRAHNILYAPELLELDQGHLVFMVENQDVVDWGIPRRFLRRSDPIVWQRVSGDKPRWYSERMVFSVFMVKNLAWQRGMGGAA